MDLKSQAKSSNSPTFFQAAMSFPNHMHLHTDHQTKKVICLKKWNGERRKERLRPGFVGAHTQKKRKTTFNSFYPRKCKQICLVAVACIQINLARSPVFTITPTIFFQPHFVIVRLFSSAFFWLMVRYCCCFFCVFCSPSLIVWGRSLSLGAQLRIFHVRSWQCQWRRRRWWW